MKRDNKQLYERIMRNVSHEVKKTLNEAGFVEQKVKKNKIYTKYIVFYIVGYDTDPYMHPSAIGFNSEDKIINYAYRVIDSDDWRFDYYEREKYYKQFLDFFNENVPKLHVGQFAQLEIKNFINFIILRQK